MNGDQTACPHGHVFRVALLTPPGRGAVATVHVEGTSAVERVGALFQAASRRSLGELPTDRLAFGRFRLGEGVYDEVVVRRSAEDSVEIHCHGGPAVVERIMAELVGIGGERVGASDWVRARCASPIVADAHNALANVTTRRAAAILVDQYNGALDRALVEIVALLEQNAAEDAAGRIADLLDVAECGCHLTRPWRIVLAGRPNVGKSSLINALVGYRRAIVHETAGTTRDVVTARTALAGWPVEFSDTAGLRPADQAVEQEGIELARREVQRASLVLLVLDPVEACSEEEEALLRERPDALPVYNKIDLVECVNPRLPAGVAVSATQGTGIDELTSAIVERLVPCPPSPGQAVPFRSGHRDVLRSAADALSSGETAVAAAQISRLLQ